jgi:hypothetical protein
MPRMNPESLSSQLCQGRVGTYVRDTAQTIFSADGFSDDSGILSHCMLPKMWQSRELPSVGNISPQSGALVDRLSHILIVDRATRIVAVPHVM